MKLITKTIFFGLLFFIFNCSAHLEQNDKESTCENIDELRSKLKESVGKCLDLPHHSNQSIKNKCRDFLFAISTYHKIDAMDNFFNDKILEKPFIEKGLLLVNITDAFGIPLNEDQITLSTINKFHQDHPEYTLSLQKLKKSDNADITYRYSIEYNGYVTPFVEASLNLLYFFGLKKTKNEKI